MQATPQLEYDVVDVFTREAFAGNPLAVVHGTEGLVAPQLQALAREFNLSETAFPTVLDAARYRLRVFTPQVELPFAGHPSVGAAWALRERGLVRGPGLQQECAAGTVAVDVGCPDGDGTVWLTGSTPSVAGAVDPGPALAAVGLHEPDLLGRATLVAGTGLDFCYLLVRPDAVARAAPDLRALRRLAAALAAPLATVPGGGVGGAARVGPLGGVSVVGWPGDAGPGADAVRVRVFADDIGVPEDPATGSAALGLGVALVAVGLLPGDGASSFTLSQGVELGRPSTLACRVDAVAGAAVRCRVGGSVVPVARGTVRVPPLR